MKKISVLFFFLVLASNLFSQEKFTLPVDHKPAYIARHFNDIMKNEGKNFGRRYGDVPEQRWMVTLPKPICTRPTVYYNYVVAPSFSQTAHAIVNETGVIYNRSNNLGSTCLFIYISDLVNIQTFGLNGRYYSYRIDIAGRSINGSVRNGIVGIYHEGQFAYFTKAIKHPAKMAIHSGKMVSEPDTDLPAGVSAVLCKAGSNFWLGLENGQIHSFSSELTKSPTFITLEKTYANSLAGDHENLYVTTADKQLIAFNGSTGKELWRKELRGLCYDRLVVDGDRLYVNARNFYVINATTGETLFEKGNLDAEGFGRTAPVITKNRIYTCDRKGFLHIFDKTTFEQYQVINLDEEVLVDFLFYENSIYIGTMQSKFYRLDVSFY